MTPDDNQILNVQPHSDDAEMAVLGSMLASKEAVSQTIQWLGPEHFYKDGNGKIFSHFHLYKNALGLTIELFD